MDTPLAGQRWMSESEPELGLGLVLEADASCVRLLFPLRGETRRYSMESAALRRLRFGPGDVVEGGDGTRFRIERVTEEDGCRIHHGEGNRLHESQLADRADKQGPRERFLQGLLDPPAAFDLRLVVWKRRHQLAQHPATGLLGGRIEWIPHQIAIAHEISRRVLPRVLLADEVGLGKTIEACLILHHGLVTGRFARVLILVPAPLLHQWFVELLRRFQLKFAIYDDARCESIREGNPFLDEQCVLCPVELLASSARWRDAAVSAGWDLLIVDEAHHLNVSEGVEGDAYRAVEALARCCPSVMLLTATPEQMGTAAHFAHLRLLDPERYPSFAAFQVEQGRYTLVAEEAERLRGAGDRAALRRLLDQHGPGRVLFRNTREQVKGFPRRVAHPLRLSGGEEGRLRWLTEFVQQNPRDKILVMTRDPKEVKALDEELRERGVDRIVLFHEGQGLIERDRQAAWFAEAEGARVMIASDIGGEGRNFQFVRHLVLFDVPRDPERIEQRIGRLDRIGQRQDVEIHLPVLRGSAEEGVMRWLLEGLGIFARPLQCGRRCLELFRERLDAVDEALIAETRATVERLENEQRTGRHRLLLWKHELEENVEAELRMLRSAEADPDLLPFAEKVWTALGLELEKLRQDDYVLRIGSFYNGELPMREEGRRLTPKRRRALEREDMELLTWDHPLLRDATEALLASPRGHCACARGEGLRGPVLQAVFVLEALAPAGLQVGRFLPPTPMLVCVDAQGKSVAVPKVGAAFDPAALLENPEFRREWLPSRLEDAESLAERESRTLRRAAKREAERLLSDEARRLRELREINDHVREEEIVFVERQREAVCAAIEASSLRLDALRLLLP